MNLANHLVGAGWPVGLLPLQTGGHSFPVDPRVELHGNAPQGGNRYVRGLRKLRYVGGVIRRFRPDVVVSLGAGFGYLTSPTIRTPFQLVTQIATDPAYLLSRSHFDRVTYRRAFRRSARIVFQTRAAMEYFDDDIRRKGVIISNPLRDGLVHNSAPFASRDKEIVSFGRLVPQKRFDVLVDAFEQFHQQRPGYRLMIFGEGDLRDTLQRQIDERGLSDTATLAGFRDDVHERIRNAAMYVLSSEVEGLPNAMLEAMALGIPSICTDCAPGGARETIEEFGSGVLVPLNDPTALSDAMVALVDEPER
ncbi:MAG: glycosyltransferase, partial [Microbacterium sp.]